MKSLPVVSDSSTMNLCFQTSIHWDFPKLKPGPKFLIKGSLNEAVLSGLACGSRAVQPPSLRSAGRRQGGKAVQGVVV